ncbi:MAG: LysR family transcriptional regulator, partial [Planctomycetaceae bacterium]
HKLARKSRIAPADLNGENFIAFDQNIPTRRFIDGLLKADGATVNITMEFDNVELLKRAVEVGSGIGILPLENVKAEVEYGGLSYIRFRNPETWKRPVAIIRRRGKAPSPAERMFLAILRTDPGKEEA